MIKWTNFELGVTLCAGIVIGITIILLFLSPKETIITDHEIVIYNFLGYEELMVVKKN